MCKIKRISLNFLINQNVYYKFAHHNAAQAQLGNDANSRKPTHTHTDTTPNFSSRHTTQLHQRPHNFSSSHACATLRIHSSRERSLSLSFSGSFARSGRHMPCTHLSNARTRRISQSRNASDADAAVVAASERIFHHKLATTP